MKKGEKKKVEFNKMMATTTKSSISVKPFLFM